MEYQLEARTHGVFRSLLELQWFCFLRQRTSQVTYVGHVDRWRDFVIEGRSVEVKPEIGSVADAIKVVAARIPEIESRLYLLFGSPDKYKLSLIHRVGDSFENKTPDWSV